MSNRILPVTFHNGGKLQLPLFMNTIHIAFINGEACLKIKKPAQVDNDDHATYYCYQSERHITKFCPSSLELKALSQGNKKDFSKYSTKAGFFPEKYPTIIRV